MLFTPLLKIQWEESNAFLSRIFSALFYSLIPANPHLFDSQLKTTTQTQFPCQICWNSTLKLFHSNFFFPPSAFLVLSRGRMLKDIKSQLIWLYCFCLVYKGCYLIAEIKESVLRWFISDKPFLDIALLFLICKCSKFIKLFCSSYYLEINIKRCTVPQLLLLYIFFKCGTAIAFLIFDL